MREVRFQLRNLRPMPVELQELAGSKPYLAQLLWQRGWTELPPEAELSSPLDLPQLETGARLVWQAIETGQPILVYGDYDVDGVTATAVLYRALHALGAKVEYHVPDRFEEGYGLNKERLEQAAAAGIQLVLTCDCGISNSEEVDLARKLGLQVVITDHHLPPEQLPAADAVINPHLMAQPDHPAAWLSGVGVAYYLLRQLYRLAGREGQERDLEQLVALGLIADVVPLLGDNRTLVRRGLQLLSSDRVLPGLRLLLARWRPEEIDEELVAFQLAPRLNAAGRLEHASLAVELLIGSHQARLQQLVQKLEALNRQRKSMGDEMGQEAEELLRLTGWQAGEPIVLWRPHWHHGILGIVAGRLCEKYRVPVLLAGLKEDGETLTGSARAPAGYHCREALQAAESWLLKYGGHAEAAGFSLRRTSWDGFVTALRGVLQTQRRKLTGPLTVYYDLPFSLADYREDLAREWLELKPFGAGNPPPVFLLSEVEIVAAEVLARRHLKLTIRQHELGLTLNWWLAADRLEQIPAGSRGDLLVQPLWQRGRTELICLDFLPRARLEPRMLPEVLIEDWRCWQEEGRQLPAWPDSWCYRWGRDYTPPRRAETLVLLQPPPAERRLRELLALTGARRLVLAFGPGDLPGPESFLRNLLLLIKASLAPEPPYLGSIHLERAAAWLGETAETVFLGLQVLQARHFLQLLEVEGEELLLQKGPGDGKGEPRLEASLQAALKESAAFRRFLLEKEIDRIRLYL
ncbi:MAG: single-stranded-DNA-specific exonuclease RecJ [Bacillota bacterium]